mgnify:CR=1 FL=1
MKTVFTLIGITVFLCAALLFGQKESYSARLYFESTRFPVTHVNTLEGFVVITQEVPIGYISSSSIDYRDCPLDTESVWSFQSHDFIKVNYTIMGQVVGSTQCPRDLTLKQVVGVLLGR